MELIHSDLDFEYYKIHKDTDSNILIEIANKLAQTFAKNPIEIAYNITEDDLYPHCKEWIKAYADDNLSYVAKSKLNKTWAGVVCNNDFGFILNYKKEDDNCVGLSIMTDVMHMVHELEQKVQLKYFPDMKFNQVFHIDLLAVHPDYSGKGLGSKLFKLSYDEAIKMRYSAIVVSASNNRTTHIATQKFNFTKLPEEFLYSTWLNQFGLASLNKIEESFPDEAMRILMLKL